jgi:hypothetical protein
MVGRAMGLPTRELLVLAVGTRVTLTQIKAAVRAAFYVVVIGTSGYLVWNYDRLKDTAEKVPQLEARVALLASGYETLSNEVIRRAEFDAALRDRRATINSEVEKAANEEPAVADYLHERIPDGLREAHRRGSAK